MQLVYHNNTLTTKIIKLLLEYGFKPDKQNLENANKTKNKELIEMIKGAMSKKEASKLIESSILEKEKQKMEELKFATEEEAMQHLANLTGKSIKIANDKEESTEEEESIVAEENATVKKLEDTAKIYNEAANQLKSL